MKHSELDKIDAELAQLELDKQSLLSRRAVLISSIGPQLQFNTSQKIALFIQLFRGRQDIFANRWQNKQEVATLLPAIMNGKKTNALNLK